LVIAVDTGAYASGLLFGKHPMAPRISPKKTWEGFAGAVVASLIGGVLLATLMLGMPWWFGLVFGISILLSATIGDLSESLLKRDLGIKDMSSWLPGHGGFLDRLDSILPSAVIAYALFLIFA
ncbi:MAG: phosphatidate cytidylyltransferase, partial [Leifsonia sp.]